jgi:hypothetical protein
MRVRREYASAPSKSDKPLVISEPARCTGRLNGDHCHKHGPHANARNRRQDRTRTVDSWTAALGEQLRLQQLFCSIAARS